MSCCLLYVMVAAQNDPMSLWKDGRKVEQFSQSDKKTSREARFGVWIKNNQVYKLFGKEAQFNRVEGITGRAIATGVPTPAITLIAGTWYDENGKANRVWAAKTDQLHGKFFQLSKSGHLKIIENEIRNANNSDVWTKTLQGVTAAVNFKMTDPQGFFKADQDPPLSFIDIHSGSTPASGLVDLKAIVEGLLN